MVLGISNFLFDLNASFSSCADSVMVKFAVPEDKRHDMATHFEIAQRVADQISETFPPPIELEFEVFLIFTSMRVDNKQI